MDSIFQYYNQGDKSVLNDPSLLSMPPIKVVIHFAALKAVGESSKIPLDYYRNNVYGTISLLDTMKKHGVRKLIFSSSAVVYGLPNLPKGCQITEDIVTPTATNPYGRSKKMCEEVIQDLCRADEGWKVILLRYFNPVGAHPDSVIGEDPLGIPNNLMPFVARVAACSWLKAKSENDETLTPNTKERIVSERELELAAMTHLSIFGNDYDTKDGTGMRDYIHVVDLAKGHVSGLKAVLYDIPNNGPWFSNAEQYEKNKSICRVYNLGCGVGYSVLDVVNTFVEANQVAVPFLFTNRRAGDVPELIADPSRAKKELSFECKRNLVDMCKDMWRWQCKITQSI